MTFEELKTLQEKYEEEILSSQGIHGIGIGRREKDGELSFLIYAESQSAVNAFQGKNLLPDVQVPFEYMVEPPLKNDILYVDDNDRLTQDQGRYRPLMGGIQIYLRDGSSAWVGTIGTFVRSQSAGDSNLYMLSNRHVLEKVGLAVSQPLYGSENIVAWCPMRRSFVTRMQPWQWSICRMMLP